MMKKLNYELKNLTAKNKNGSQSTQSDRRRYLQLIARQLERLGFKHMGVSSLKPKHVWALVRYWQTEVSPHAGRLISNGTIKNRMTVLRWWATKIDRASSIPRKNKELGIEDRIRLPIKDKAFSLSEKQKIDLPKYLQLSVRLQQEFGLRREESAKFNISKAEYETHIKLIRSWTKGGRERVVPIQNETQRELLNEVREYAPNSSLVPAHMNYAQYLSHRKYVLGGIGLRSTHGLRHFYAQQRYLELSKGLRFARICLEIYLYSNWRGFVAWCRRVFKLGYRKTWFVI